MGSMKQQLLPTRCVSVVAQCGDILYDASVERERRRIQAFETQSVFASVEREPPVRRFPRRTRPMAVRYPLIVRIARAVWRAVKQEWAR